jgi:hypothetical protein
MGTAVMLHSNRLRRSSMAEKLPHFASAAKTGKWKSKSHFLTLTDTFLVLLS